MARSTYPITNRPAALRERLGPALARCQSLKEAFEAAADLALYQRPQALKALPAPARAALIVVTTTYNDEIARDRYKGRGLKVEAGQGAAALWQIEDQALRNSALGLLASYSGW